MSRAQGEVHADLAKGYLKQSEEAWGLDRKSYFVQLQTFTPPWNYAILAKLPSSNINLHSTVELPAEIYTVL